MSKRIIIYAAVILTVLNLTILGVLAYHHWFQSAPDQPHTGFERIKAEVGLSPAQIDTLEKYRQQFHAELDSLGSLLTEERQALAREIRQAEPDTARMQTILDSIGRLQKRSQWRIIQHLFQLKATMTPEQQERFLDIVLERFVTQPQGQVSGRRYAPPCDPQSN